MIQSNRVVLGSNVMSISDINQSSVEQALAEFDELQLLLKTD